MPKLPRLTAHGLRHTSATLMLATHDSALAALADARLRLRGGRVEADGN